MLRQALILTAHREYAAMFRQHLALSIAPDARVDVETDPLRAMQLSPQQYDLILLDSVIGDMDCFQFMSVMKKQARQTRFVVISEEASELYRFQAYHNGADLFLPRPQTDAQWQEAIDQLAHLLEPSTVPLVGQLGEASSLKELLIREAGKASTSLVQVDIIGNSGDIFFHEGQLYHAQCSGFSGERAFADILSWPAEDMRVKVHPLHYTPPRTIEKPLSELLQGNAEVDSLELSSEDKQYAVTPPTTIDPLKIPTEMATVEAPPLENEPFSAEEPPQPATSCDMSFRSPSLIGHWKITLEGRFQDGCGPIDMAHTTALTDFIYRKMATVAVALEEDYFQRLTLLGPEYRQEIVADNLGVRHALFKAAEATPQETEAFIQWCYGQGI